MIQESELVRVMSGNIGELKEFVNGKELEEEELKRLLEDEKVAQNRKSAKQFLSDKIDERRFSEDFSRASRELDDILGSLDKLKNKHLGDESFEYEEMELDQMEIVGIIEGPSDEFKQYVKENDLTIKQMEELLQTEKKAKDRKNVKTFLETRVKNKKLYRDIKDAKSHIKDIKQDFKNIEGESEYLESSDSGIEPHKAMKEEKDKENSKDPEQPSKQNDDREKEEYSQVNKQEKDTEEQEEENQETETSQSEKEEKTPLERKRAILEDIEVELSDEELEQITVEKLKELQEEKDEREKLMDKLEENGIDTDKLEESTTEDLKKIVSEIESKKEEEENQKQAQGKSEEKSDTEDEENKSKEEIEEEAEEDLEMLMGARHGQKEKETEKDSTMDKIEDIKHRLEKFIERPEPVESKGVDEDKLISLLEHYKVIPNKKEKAVKTAQVMKGYLEHRINAERELTYGELAESLESVEDENVEILKDFYYKMSNDEYMEKISVENMNEVIEASMRAIEELN